MGPEIKRLMEQEMLSHFPNTTFHITAKESIDNEVFIRVEVNADCPEYHQTAEKIANQLGQMYDINISVIAYQRCLLAKQGNFTIHFTGASDVLSITFLPHNFVSPVYTPSFLEELKKHEQSPSAIWNLVFPARCQREADKLGFGDEFQQPTYQEELQALLEEFRPAIEQVLISQGLARISNT